MALFSQLLEVHHFTCITGLSCIPGCTFTEELTVVMETVTIVLTWVGETN
jgi:hypothetical protein